MKKHKARYAGISVIESDNIKQLRFHVTGATNRPVGLWMKVPGKASFNFLKLPRTLSKINAARYLLQQKEFKNAMYQNFLREQIERRINGESVNPRQGMPIRRREQIQRPTVVAA